MKRASGAIMASGRKTLRTSRVSSTKASRAIAASVARTSCISPVGRRKRRPTTKAAIDEAVAPQDPVEDRGDAQRVFQHLGIEHEAHDHGGEQQPAQPAHGMQAEMGGDARDGGELDGIGHRDPFAASSSAMATAMKKATPAAQ